MNRTSHFVRNTVLLFTAQSINIVLGFVYVTLIARHLGVVEFGILSFSQAFTQMFSTLTDLGLNLLVTREIAKNPAGPMKDKYFWNACLIKLAFLTIALTLIAVSINLTSDSDRTIYVVYIFGLSLVFSTFAGTINSLMQAYEKTVYQSIGMIIYSISLMAGILIVLLLNLDVLGVALVYLAANFLTFVFLVITCSGRFIRRKIEFDFPLIRNMVKDGIPLGLNSIFITAYSWVDTVLLSYLRGDSVVGWYNASYRVMFYFIMIPAVLNVTIFPLMSRLCVTSDKDLKLVAGKYFKILMIIVLPVAVGITIGAGRIISLVYGDDYSNSILALRILIWSIVFTFANASFTLLFQAINKPMVITRISAFSVVVNVVLNLVFIPYFGLIASSIITVVTEFLVAFMIIIYARRLGYFLKGREFLSMTFKVVTASLAMGLCEYFLLPGNILFTLAVSMIVYVVMIMLSGVLDDLDIRMIKSVLKLDKSGQTRPAIFGNR